MKLSRRGVLKGAAGVALAGLVDAAPGAWTRAHAQTASTPYQLQTPFFSISGQNGGITELRFAPQGNGQYHQNVLTGPGWYFQLTSDGAPLVGQGPVSAHVSQNQLVIEEIPFYNHLVIAQTAVTNGYDVALGGGAGQTFVAPAVTLSQLGLNLFAAFGALPTGSLTVAIRSGGVFGPVVWQTAVEPNQLAQLAPGSTLTYLPLPDLVLTAGQTYAITLVTADDAWAVQYAATAPYPAGAFYGWGWQANPDKDMAFVLVSPTGTVEYTGTWTLTCDGPNLTSTLALTAQGAHEITKAGFEWVLPWVMDGYDTGPSVTPFVRFYDDEGENLPIQEFKRRPSMFGEFSFDIGTDSIYVEAKSRQWIYCLGQRGYDLKFYWNDIRLHWTMSPNQMTYKFYQSGYASAAALTQSVSSGQRLSFPFNLELLPQTGQVPSYYPKFSSNNRWVNDYLTTFYWDRAYSWLRGATGTDWKDWLGRSLDWTGSPLRDGEKECLEAIALDDDGYVWTWNPPQSRGWPFPNPTEYDTRHFTTNAMYVLGIYHYFVWTQDRQFLSRMLPRAQKAIGYYLTKLGGNQGLVTIDVPASAPDHTALDGAVGVNYWDITAHGFKDAYTNAYFYAAVQALAELEHAAHDPLSDHHQRFADHIRETYRRVFWNPQAGRFVQAIDQQGHVHDHGAVYVNLEAVFLGLATDEQVRRIFQWLDHGSTQLTTLVTYNPSGGTPIQCPVGGTLGQSFTASAPFAQVAGQFPTWGTVHSGMTLTLYRGGPGGPVVAQKTYTDWGDGGWAPLTFDPQPAGSYYLELSHRVGTIGWWGSSSATPVGQAYQNGQPLSNPKAFSLAVLSPYQTGPKDIYSQWKWAPRTTTHKNNFWYVWLWGGVTVPWGGQLQDGGADLYMVGFDVMARARYLGADAAWERMQAVLERYALPDRLCGGNPLYLGEHPQNEVSAGSVGVDVPFPESGLAPASFVYAFMGIKATIRGLYIKPNLPSAIDWVQVEGVNYRGLTLTIKVVRHQVWVNGKPGVRHLVSVAGLPQGRWERELDAGEEHVIL